ncbi:Ribosomal RNA-processing protein 7 [Golovinomyces cichoracearum]|uniref:Ribosomal RNA-processing protein 7 n=1 Tax=Golovinomyces cichoracearum TaxID=62708 RepID=A0A420HGB6_9PEZI|nr:Ribosomal RNA-processing protein 7 [Golovinomyces cichoracearum]
MSQSNLVDYVLLNISMPKNNSFPEQTLHTIYLRAHQSKIPDINDSRSLFLVNVPIDSTVSHFRVIISSLIGPGRFESISFGNELKSRSINPQKHPSSEISSSKKRKRVADIEQLFHEHDLPDTWDRKLCKSGSSAIIILVDENCVKKTLKTIMKLHKHKKSTNKWPIWGDGITSSSSVPSLGGARYLSHHKLRFPDPHYLQSLIDAFMLDFNAQEKDRHESEKKLRNIPDADGFVTVTRGGRTGPARIQVVEEKMASLEEREEKKREEMRKAGFYRFQGRERRKAEAEELLRRFEEDKKKMQELRERRGKAGFEPES